MTILYWAWPRDGAGHATRAAAICRHLEDDVLVIRGNPDPEYNRALDAFGVPYTVIENRKEATQFALDTPGKLVLDDGAGGVLEKRASLYIWRTGRPRRLKRPIPTVRIEGPGAIGPVLMLSDAEIMSKEEAREDLGLPQDKTLSFGIKSTARPGVVESFNPDYMLEAWPALRWMRGADLIIGTMGANLYGEVAYLGLPAQWIIAPGTRDQYMRSTVMPEIHPVPDAARKIARMIEEAK